MQERAIYFGKSEIYQKIRDAGGKWDDPKERPIVCLIKSTENEGLFWAIPMGNWKHRDLQHKEKIKKYMSYDDLRSCYYHIGRTTVKSIFFISDVFPITDKYIKSEYIGYDGLLYIIKNQDLVQAIKDKLGKILSFEKSRPNYFRQHITDIKNILINELQNEKKETPVKQEIEAAKQEAAPTKQNIEIKKQEETSGNQETVSIKQEVEKVKQEIEAVKQEVEKVKQEVKSANQEAASTKQESQENKKEIKKQNPKKNETSD